MRFLVALSLLGFASHALAAYSTNTDALYSALDECSSDVGSDIACIETVKEGLETMSGYIQDLKDLQTNMDRLDAGLDTFNTIVSIAKYAPGIGTACTVLKTTISVIRPPFNTALTALTSVNNKVYPWKDRIDTGAEHCGTAITYLGYLESACDTGVSSVGSARTCVNSMVTSTLKTTLGSSLEDLGGSLEPSISDANQALGVVGSGCETIKSYTDIGLGWPDISFIIDGIDEVYDALSPILDFFEDLQSVLDYDLCIPNPWEAIAELEILEEVAEAFNPGNWGWGRRRRSLPAVLRDDATYAATKRAVITITRSEANSLLAVSKRGDICLSAQDILDGVDSLLSPLVDLANDLISEVMSVLPEFDIPGFPDFNNIFDINYSFDLPDIDFGFDVDDYLNFAYLEWDCSLEITTACNALSGGASADCSASIESFAPDYTAIVEAITIDLSDVFSGGWSWGRKRRSLTNEKKRSMADEKIMSNVIALVRSMKEKHRTPPPADATVSTRQQPKLRPAVTKRVTLDLEVLQDYNSTRQDNKELTEEEATRIAENMTPEQRERLRQRVKDRLSGGSGTSTEAPDSSEAPDSTEAPEDNDRREAILELLRRMRQP